MYPLQKSISGTAMHAAKGASDQLLGAFFIEINVKPERLRQMFCGQVCRSPFCGGIDMYFL
ncbi:hypothetical protein CXP35_07890 [Komagataeibacter xylinus]|nr:hypothetical protein CXP35_07890 [Komagataeibacter xylinus]